MNNWINYDPSAPNLSYFTIGELVASLALALTFLQLAKPITRFRLRAHGFNTALIIIFGLIAILFVFLAAALPFIPGKAYPLISYPVFWEALGGLILVSLVLRGIYVVSTKPIFTKKNAATYWKATYDFIARGSISDFNEFATEIEPSITSVFRYARDIETPTHGDANSHAHAVLALWSDKDLCRAIATKAYETARLVFAEATNDPSNLSSGHALVREIIHQEFLNQDSTLMREREASGIGHFTGLTHSVFGNWAFISSDYRPLYAWRHHEEVMQQWQAKKYCECLKIAFNAYLNTAPNTAAPALSLGISVLPEIASTQIQSLVRLEETALSQSPALSILSEIEDGLIGLLDITESHAAVLVTSTFDPSTYLRNGASVGDRTIFGILARGIYGYLEALARCYQHDDHIFHRAIRLWLRVFATHGNSRTTVQIEVSQRLIVHLEEKIDDNFKSGRPLYPAITRLLITLCGLREPSIPPSIDVEHGFYDRFMTRLKTYPIVAKNDPKFAADMLPDHCEYVPAQLELRYKPNRMRNDVLTLNPLNS